MNNWNSSKKTRDMPAEKNQEDYYLITSPAHPLSISLSCWLALSIALTPVPQRLPPHPPLLTPSLTQWHTHYVSLLFSLSCSHYSFLQILCMYAEGGVSLEEDSSTSTEEELSQSITKSSATMEQVVVGSCWILGSWGCCLALPLPIAISTLCHIRSLGGLVGGGNNPGK